MQFRSFILLGFCASLVINAPAIAGTPPANQPPIPIAPPAAQAEIIKVATPKADVGTVKKKKATVTGKNKSKSAKKPLTKEELAAKAKADEKKKLEAAAKEKAKLLAKAKADKEKQIAAAKAEREKKLALAKADREKKLAAAKIEKDKRLAAEAKAAAERKVALAKAEEERKLARAKADQERQLARAKAEEERKLAKAKAEEDRRLAAAAKAKAAEDLRLAKLRAEEERRLAIAKAAEDAHQAEIARLVSMEIAQTGNNGELRSEKPQETKSVGLFGGLFGSPKPKVSMLPETRALDAVLEQKEAKKKFEVKPEFEPQSVAFSGYATGTIVVDTASRYLYLVESASKARRYAIAVGREGLEFKGTGKIGDKQEWPRWIPTIEMQEREPAKYGIYKDGMPGGPENPLGARAMYVYQNGKDTHIRIHGTNQPQTIGTNSSNGCFRMINDQVMDLYRRVKVGADVVVM